MKVNIISQKRIKPCVPTPVNLSRYKLSYVDELIPPMNIGIILYYASKPENISQLEESLATILPQFYPLAGRYIKQDRAVDCSDEGAELVLAEAVDAELCDVVEKSTTSEQLRGLLPQQYYRIDEAATTPLLSVQITGFKCGGAAMSISISHRIFDLSSVATFITAWRNANNPGGGGGGIIPSLDGPSLFPANVDQPYSFNIPMETFPEFVVRRFVFDRRAIASLRSELKPSSRNGRAISRVRVVSALMSKALIRLDRARHGIPRDCVIAQAVNIRERTIPALPNHSCGNLILLSSTPRIAADEIGIQDLVDAIGDDTVKTLEKYCSKILVLPCGDRGKIAHDRVSDVEAKLEGGEVNMITFSDCSKIGLRHVDFGWGKPVWARIGPIPSENMIVLMENKEDDGIEAWLHLKEDDMSYLEQDEDISLFAA